MYSLLSSDGVVFTSWVKVEIEGTIKWLFGEGYNHILDLRPFILL